MQRNAGADKGAKLSESAAGKQAAVFYQTVARADFLSVSQLVSA